MCPRRSEYGGAFITNVMAASLFLRYPVTIQRSSTARLGTDACRDGTDRAHLRRSVG